MRMTDFQERWLTATRTRHLAALDGELAAIEQGVGIMRTKLGNGEVPWIMGLREQAARVADRLEALATLAEFEEVIRSEEAPS